jgi:hypothetical protein
LLTHQSKQVLAGPYGVFQATNVAALVAAAEAALKPPFNTTLLYERWGLTIDDASTVPHSHLLHKSPP